MDRRWATKGLVLAAKRFGEKNAASCEQSLADGLRSTRRRVSSFHLGTEPERNQNTHGRVSRAQPNWRGI